jgi:hypothetical protein
MEAKMTVRYCSGREEQFEVEIYGGGSAELRLREFVKNPTLVLQTDGELILIPAHAIETVSLEIPEEERERLPLDNIRKAKRVK